MHEIAKTLLLFPSLDKWQDFDTNYSTFFSGLDESFDALVGVLRTFHAEHQKVPHITALQRILMGANDRDLLSYVDRVAQDITLRGYPDDADFAVALDQLKTQTFVGLIQAEGRKFETTIATERGVYPEKVLSAVDVMMAGVQQAVSRHRQSDLAVALRMHGEEAMQRMRDRYFHNKERAENDESIYYSIPFKHFEDVQLTAGDLLTIVGYTSQCKSVLAREICYKLLIKDGLNVAFWSTEMPAEDVEILFAVRHANNKALFPGTPKIAFKAWKLGTLTEEEEAFFFHAHRDLVTNEAYGALHVEQPSSTAFNLADLAQRCAAIEHTFMPIHVCGVDYLMQLNPLAHGARASGDKKADVNRMVAEFRLFGLTYRHIDGTKAPLICITPAQISRGKYQEALKNDKMYDSDAPSDFNEIERSSSVMLSVLMDREMRAEGRLRIQCLKNRMGEVPVDAYEVYAALAYGMGLQEFDEPSADDLTDRLIELDTMTWGAMAPA